MGVHVVDGEPTFSTRGNVAIFASNALHMAFDFEAEIARIDAAARAGQRFTVTANWSCPPAAIRRTMDLHAPEVVHILAPTVDSEHLLYLSDENGGLLRLRPAEVVDVLSRSAEMPKLVVINTCRSLPVAEALCDYAGATIGMRALIGDAYAVAFADRLYGRLAGGATIAEAFEEARLEVPPQQRNVPVLLGGRGDPRELTIGSPPLSSASPDGPPSAVVKAFCSYAHEDVEHLEEFKKFLAPMRRSGVFDMWHDRLLQPSQHWEREIDENISLARIMILLVTKDFLDSEYCIGREFARARERSSAGSMEIIPILVSSCPWTLEPALKELQVLPTGAKPVSKWRSHDEAWTDVVEHLHPVIQTMAARSSSKDPGRMKSDALPT